MRYTKWNKDWYVTNGMAYSLALTPEKWAVQLPDDRMIREVKTEETKNKNQTGFYPGGVYTYLKSFPVPEDWKEKKIQFFFEGVQGKTRVYVNGNYAGRNQTGYAGFLIDANDFLEYGNQNEIVVLVDAQEQGSRWYPGSGIYRDVWLLEGEKVSVSAEGIRVSTPEVDPEVAVALVEIPVENKDLIPHGCQIRISIFDEKKQCVSRENVKVTAYSGQRQTVRQRMTVEQPHLWSTETPSLYQCKVELLEKEKLLDLVESTFGIRRLRLDRKYGLRINGESVKLRGACIHHDHGIVGAEVFAAAEERKIWKLKEAGFNCIRSAHNPCSRALLEVCDRSGMLVMDELSDVWTLPKNVHDDSLDFPVQWKQLVEDMVRKDFNHPSVILYSMGNELPEAGRARGGYWNREVNDYFKSLDDTRYTTNAANGTMATMYRNLPEMVMKVRRELGMEEEQKIDSVDAEGAAFLNMMMAAQSGPVADRVVCLPEMDEALTEFESAMDIAGYNYMTTLHKLDGERYPNRLLLATETYPEDVARIWADVQENVNVLGEMTWTGYDYIGESGIGMFYYDGTKNFDSRYPNTLAYIGDIDQTGYRRPVSYYREIVYGLRKQLYIAVQRPEHFGEEFSPSPWLFSDSVESWTWPGFEDKPIIVEVYSCEEEVELYINGELIERKNVGEEKASLVRFTTKYVPGELMAVGYVQGKETSRMTVQTAGEETQIHAYVDQKEVKTDDLAYVVVEMTDQKGTVQRTRQHKILAEVSGDGVFEGMGSAEPRTAESYQKKEWTTYEGRLLLAVRTGEHAGKVTVTLEDENGGTDRVEILVKES